MRVLIVRLGAFGDIIHTLPLLTDLHAAGHSVDWLCEDRWRVLLDAHPHLNRLHCLPRGRWRQQRSPLWKRWQDVRRLLRQMHRCHYDIAIDAQGLAKSALLARLSGARRCIGHRRARAREGSWLLHHVAMPATAEHVIDQQRALGLLLSGQAPRSRRWQFCLPDWSHEHAAMAHWWQQHAPRCDAWVLNVGAGWPSKIWPRERQIAFARLACAKGPGLVLGWGSPAERELAQAVQTAVPACVLAPPTTLAELAGLLRQTPLCISGDTGPLHLAMACDTPTLGLFGPVPAGRNGSRGHYHRCIQAAGEAWERRDPQRGGMHTISETQVFELATQLAAKTPPRGLTVIPADA